MTKSCWHPRQGRAQSHVVSHVIQDEPHIKTPCKGHQHVHAMLGAKHATPYSGTHGMQGGGVYTSAQPGCLACLLPHLPCHMQHVCCHICHATCMFAATSAMPHLQPLKPKLAHRSLNGNLHNQCFGARPRPMAQKLIPTTTAGWNQEPLKCKLKQKPKPKAKQRTQLFAEYCRCRALMLSSKRVQGLPPSIGPFTLEPHTLLLAVASLHEAPEEPPLQARVDDSALAPHRLSSWVLWWPRARDA